MPMKKQLEDEWTDTQPMREAYRVMITKKLMDENLLPVTPREEFTGDALSYGAEPPPPEGYVIPALAIPQSEGVTKQRLDKVCNDFQDRFKDFLDTSEYKRGNDTTSLTSNPAMTSDTNLYMESLRKLTLDKIVIGAVPVSNKLAVVSTPNTTDENFFNKFMNHFDTSDRYVEMDISSICPKAIGHVDGRVEINANDWEDNLPGSVLTFEKSKQVCSTSLVSDGSDPVKEFTVDFTGYNEATFKPSSRTMFMQTYPSVAKYEDLKEWTTEGPVHVIDATSDDVEAGVAAIYTWVTPEGELLKNGSWVRVCCVVGQNNVLMPANYRSKPADPFKVKNFIDTWPR